MSGDELTNARNAYESAKAALAQARPNYPAAIGARSANAGAHRNATEDTNPEVRWPALAATRRRSTSSAPSSARPSTAWSRKRSVQVGQRVQPGTPVMTVVPIGQAYVDANFKEGQLEACASASRSS